MLANTALRRLEQLPEISKAEKKANGLYRLMESQILWEVAYSKIAPNKGALTPGVDGQTFDGFSLEKVRTIITGLTDGSYSPKPVRRVYIPKANGKQRPLGIPTTEDKLVQEVVRMILERLYEPVFSRYSHGFRTGHSCHTALEQIQATWAGVKWLVDVDIAGFFDTIDHDVLMDILARKIDDDRFLRLIRGMLKAGYVEDWVYHQTYSGTPQGGVVSPLLANIYLNELDQFIEEKIEAFNKGKHRARTTEYMRITNKLNRLRRKVTERRGHDPEADTSHWLAEIDRATKERLVTVASDPFDPNFRRLRYCRYADDFLIGIIGSKEDARNCMAEVKEFLTTSLRLQVSEEKTGIHKATDGATFLGYEVTTYTARRIRRMPCGPHARVALWRSAADRVQLCVPPDRVRKFCERQGYGNLATLTVRHRPPLLSTSDAEIALAYNAELRGFATYYALAKDVKRKLTALYFVWRGSLLKTLANKHKSTVCQTMARLRQGTELTIRSDVRDNPYTVRVWKLKDLKSRPIFVPKVDQPPPTAGYYLGRTGIIERLYAHTCEYCGATDGPCEVHHARKLADIKHAPLATFLTAARTRKRIVLCQACHRALHAGRLPDLRSLRQVGTESRVR